MIKPAPIPIVIFLSFLLASCSQNQAPPHKTYDLVIESGRAIDPETGLDDIRHIGVMGGKIAAISEQTLHGKAAINAEGLVVAPGFIDIHSHSPTPLGTKFQALDGVTTQLDLEAGAFPISAYGFMIKDKSPINYANSVSHLAIRTLVLEQRSQPYLFTEDGPLEAGAAFITQASQEQIEEMRHLLHKGISEGGIGIGVLLDYISVAVSEAELAMIFEVAGDRNVPITVHVRRGMPGDAAGLKEVIALAEKTSAPLFICHITHSAMHAIPEWLDMIDAANARGAKITTETLSFAAGGTSIGAAVFYRDWQSIFNITYEDVQWTATGEWLNEETFKAYQANEPSGMINHHYVKEDWIETAIRWPDMMVSSDVTPAMSEDIMSNPNLAGTFARFIGHYVRERNIISLEEALAKSSLYQAQWLEQAAPAFQKKGRLQEGMDADIVIFDYDKIEAKADYGAPYQPSEGISYVIVGGEVIAQNGRLVEAATPGRHILSAQE